MFWDIVSSVLAVAVAFIAVLKSPDIIHAWGKGWQKGLATTLSI
jgi:hypothetical protein